jgi:hypothetical protein
VKYVTSAYLLSDFAYISRVRYIVTILNSGADWYSGKALDLYLGGS